MGLLWALFTSLSLYPFHLSIPLYPSLSLSIPLSPSISLSLPLSLPLSPSLSLSIPLSLSLSFSPSLSLYYLSLPLYSSPSTFLSLSFLLSLFSLSFSLAYLMDVFVLVMFDIRPCFRKDLTSDLVNLQDNKGNSPLLVCAIKNSRDTLRLIFQFY